MRISTQPVIKYENPDRSVRDLNKLPFKLVRSGDQRVTIRVGDSFEGGI